MTPEEIKEGNRTIADYAGWKLVKISDDAERHAVYQFQWNNDPTDTYNGGDSDYITEYSTLPYDSDMNWLYPVACKAMAELELYKYRFSIKPGGAAYYLYFKCLFGQPIERIFLHTVMAIEFLNRQKKTA